MGSSTMTHDDKPPLEWCQKDLLCATYRAIELRKWRLLLRHKSYQYQCHIVSMDVRLSTTNADNVTTWHTSHALS